MESSVIEMKDIWFSFNGSTVLQSVTLEVECGDFLAVIGPNGGGKTTLLKIILGLYRPDHGSIRVLGEHPANAARKIGYVPQDTAINRSFPVTVFDVASMGRIRREGFTLRVSDAGREIVETMLGKVGMRDFRDRRIGELSGGQLQRVLIARALTVEPDMLILDEPTANIDLEGQEKIYSILREINEHITVIVASHDITGVLGYAGSMAYVNRTLHTHSAPQMTPELLEKLTGTPFEHICPVEVISRMLDRQER